MSGASKQKKPKNAVVYEYGALLLKDLEKSGYELITGPYCDTAFFFQQVESALREKVEEFGEKIELFKTVLSDFSFLNLPQYRIPRFTGCGTRLAAKPGLVGVGGQDHFWRVPTGTTPVFLQYQCQKPLQEAGLRVFSSVRGSPPGLN